MRMGTLHMLVFSSSLILFYSNARLLVMMRIIGIYLSTAI